MRGTANRWRRSAAAMASAALAAGVLAVEGGTADLAGPRFLALATDRSGGRGGFDIAIHDRLTGNPLPLQTLNTAGDEVQPVLTANATLVGCVGGTSEGVSRLFSTFRLEDAEIPGLSRARGVGRMSLSAEGRVCALLTSADGRPAQMQVYDRALSRYITPERINERAGARDQPALSPDGGWFCYRYSNAAEGVRGRLVLHELVTGKVAGIPAQADMDEYAEPSLSADGRLAAFAARRGTAEDAWDVFVYDRRSRKLLPTPGLSSSSADSRPALSRDGAYVACETRRGGSWDILLYDIRGQRVLPLPGVNTSAAERYPALSLE